MPHFEKMPGNIPDDFEQEFQGCFDNMSRPWTPPVNTENTLLAERVMELEIAIKSLQDKLDFIFGNHVFINSQLINTDKFKETK